MDKIEFLKRYRDDVEMISINDVNSIITDEWQNVFKEKEQCYFQ